jgi:phosphonate transport system substrate-binding protein
MNFSKSSITALLLLGLGAQPAQAAESYSFGVLPQRSAVLTAQYWNPILKHVQDKTGIKLELRIARSAAESGEATDKGEYDFVYSNHIFQPRMTKAGYRVILKPRDEAIRGQIVTLADSPIATLRDLADKEVGFPSASAFVGYAVPMDHLLQQKIAVTAVFGGNQEGIMGQLKAGRVIAAGVNDQIMKAYAEREQIQYRVLWQSVPYLNIPIAAHPRVPKKIIAAIRKTIAAMHDDTEGAKVLEEAANVIGQKPPYGFSLSAAADYQNYRDFYRHTLLKETQ